MPLGSVTNLLFNPAVTNSMAALDDQTSMFSVAARDAVGSSGRIGMEYQRDKHGGRERLLEEALTLAIWGFGVRAIKQVYDASMLGSMKWLGVQLPDLDTGMLPQAGQDAKLGSQVLSPKLLEKFTTEFGEKNQYGILQEILANPKLEKTYQLSSMAKFGAASIVPAAAIAFAVPTLNQWLTRQLVSKEDTAKQVASKAVSSPVSSSAASATHPARPAPPNPWAAAPLAKTAWASPGLNQASLSAQSSPVLAGAAKNAPPLTPAPFYAAHAGAGGESLRFGGVGSLAANAASTILQNEQYNTLLIDGVISGGRTYKARNHVERAEIVFREVTLILFLYFAQAQIQNGINKGLGKLMNIPASLGFKDLQYIKKRATDDPSFLKTFQNDADAIRESMEGFLKNKVKDDAFGRVTLLENTEHRTQALVETIHDYFLKQRPLGKTNLVFETAIESGLIPTFGKQVSHPGFWEQMKVIAKELNPAADKALAKNEYLDLSKKIDTAGVHDLQKSMVELTHKLTEKELPNVLNQVMRLRAGSLLASNVACFAALSVVFPEIQHWITYKMTGKNYFPGLQKGDRPLPVSPVKVG
jgi:hypothetical protein